MERSRPDSTLRESAAVFMGILFWRSGDKVRFGSDVIKAGNS